MKSEYLKTVLAGLSKDKRLSEAALYFYHAEVSTTTAREYLKTLENKIKAGRGG